MSHTIELRKVSKFYSNKDTVSTGFSRIDLQLDMGEFVVITGESGSGKSTLLNVISGLDTYEEGEMFVCGEDTGGYRTEDYERYRKTYIGNIFQDFNLVNSYTVYQNIELSMLLSGRKRRECKRRIKELIELVGLTEYTRTKVSKLSGGQKQRVAIARALAKDAPIIVADEPTGNLDSDSAVKIMEILNRISRDKLVVIVTHNYNQAEPYVTRKLTMHDGKIIENKVVSQRSDRAFSMAAAEDGAVKEDDAIRGGSAAVSAEDGRDELYASLSDMAEKNENSYYGDTGEALREVMKVGGRAARNAAIEAEERGNRTAARNSGSDSRRIGRRSVDGGVSDPGDTDLGSTAPLSKSMRLGAQYRLGIRNTFNLPAKFLLLLIVYLFVVTAVLAQYGSTKESLHRSDMIGFNSFFSNTSTDRIVVKKSDKSAFKQADYDAIKAMPNIEYIVENDLGLDTSVMLGSDTLDISGPMYQASLIDESRLTYGKLPTGDYDVVVEVDSKAWAFDTISEMGESFIGKEYYLLGSNGLVEYGTKVSDHKVRVSGVILKEDSGSDGGRSTEYIGEGSGEGIKFYVSDKLSGDVLRKNIAACSKTTINFSGTKSVTESGQVIYVAPSLKSGQIYILEGSASEFYNEEEPVAGKKIDIRVDNMYFSSELKNLTIQRLITQNNITAYIGAPKEDYDSHASNVFISMEDFNALFRKGNFQMSVFMKDETLSDETITALEKAGYTALPIKETLSDITGGQGYVVKLISLGAMVLAFIVLFVIAYLVIRLIMRSRNSYYSTLRILGANKGNTSRILRVELLLMMMIAYAVDMVVVYLAKTGYIRWRYLSERLNFLNNIDYVILFGIMMLMSLMIAVSYSRKLFKASAMKTYREEA